MTPLVAQILRLLSLPDYSERVSTVKADGFEHIAVPPPPQRAGFEVKVSDSFRRDGTIVLLQENCANEFGKNWSVSTLMISDKSASIEEVTQDISGWLGGEPRFPARSAQFFFVDTPEGRKFLSLGDAMAWHEQPAGSLVSVTINDLPAVSVLHMETRPA